MIVDLIIPALDEEGAIGPVVQGFLAWRGRGILRRVVVVDNGSCDETARRAAEAGAVVVAEPRRGYGSACLCGIQAIRADPPEIVVFADGDGAADAADLPRLLAPISLGRAELVIGSRVRRSQPEALTRPQRFGNALAAGLLGTIYGAVATDLGPYRAIRFDTLERLGMSDPDFGWTVEMQVKAAKLGVRTAEVEVESHARRAGQSKISGDLRGAAKAGLKILSTLARHARPR